MIDITQRQHSPNILNVAYIFTNLDYLVADKYGNFYNLEHCLHKRTQEFKLLKKSKYRIYYNGTAYSLSTLRKLAIKSNIKI